jgi:hypothetical protein
MQHLRGNIQQSIQEVPPCNKRLLGAKWLTPVTLFTQEAEIKNIMIQS